LSESLGFFYNIKWKLLDIDAMNDAHVLQKRQSFRKLLKCYSL
jgi:hypothetical protein